MFLKNYLDEFKYNTLFDIYEIDFLNSINEDNFSSIYNLFKKYNFYYIDDIILNYLEIFTLDSEFVENKINKLKDILGDNYIYIIGNDLRYLEVLVKDNL